MHVPPGNPRPERGTSPALARGRSLLRRRSSPPPARSRFSTPPPWSGTRCRSRAISSTRAQFPHSSLTATVAHHFARSRGQRRLSATRATASSLVSVEQLSSAAPGKPRCRCSVGGSQRSRIPAKGAGTGGRVAQAGKTLSGLRVMSSTVRRSGQGWSQSWFSEVIIWACTTRPYGLCLRATHSPTCNTVRADPHSAGTQPFLLACPTCPPLSQAHWSPTCRASIGGGKQPRTYEGIGAVAASDYGFTIFPAGAPIGGRLFQKTPLRPKPATQVHRHSNRLDGPKGSSAPHQQVDVCGQDPQEPRKVSAGGSAPRTPSRTRRAGPRSKEPGSTTCSASSCFPIRSASASRIRTSTGSCSPPPRHRPARCCSSATTSSATSSPRSPTACAPRSSAPSG